MVREVISMKSHTRWALVAIVLGFVSGPALGQGRTKIKPETTKAYDLYLKTVMMQVEASLNGSQPFLVSDRNPRSRVKLQQGDIIVHNFAEDIDIPSGIVHDWHGAMFIPGVTAEHVMQVLRDYDRHKDIYPEVVDSKLLGKEGDTYRYFQRLRKTKVLTAVLNTEHEATFLKVADNRWQVCSSAKKIAEVENEGEADEAELPVGDDRGFLWRMDACWHLEEGDGGVYAEVGALTLSRSIPFGLGWVVKPFIESMPRESVEGLLQATRIEAKRVAEGGKGQN
jgi:hypothetical protein